MKRKSKSQALLLTIATFSTIFAVSTSCSPSAVVPVDDIDAADASFKVALNSGAAELAVGGTDSIVISDVKMPSAVTPSYSFSSSDPSVVTVDANGAITAVKTGSASIIVVEDATDAANSIKVRVSGTAATGYFDYSGDGYEVQQDILAVLEKYAQDKYLTGIPLCGDGSHIMYNSRVQKGVETYIKDYGFGILQYGKLTSALSGESIAKYNMYYHDYQTEDPHNINVWNSNSSTVSDMGGNIGSQYFGVKLNDTKDDYEYYPVLAKDGQDNWTALDPSADTSPKATKFKLYVKTKDDGLKYGNLSSKSEYSAYNDRGVELEDYLTPFKCLFTKKYNLYRGAEQVAADYARPVAGAAKYWNASESWDAWDDAANTEFEKDVGVSVGTDDGGSFIQINLSKAITVSDAKSNLGDMMWEPLPMDFIKLVGGADKYGYFSEDNTLSPVDTTLSLGAYTLEYWEKDGMITYKRNPSWIEDTASTGMWNIAGIHTDILAAAKSDTEAAFKEFLNNKLDACSIPGTYLNEYKADPRTVEIPEQTTWKVNVNACNEDLWEELFGENGTIISTSKDKYWKVKPIMSNQHFLDGLYYSVDRATLADSQNFTPSQDYLSHAYYFTDDDGGNHYYYESDAHKNAIKDRYPEQYGYNVDAAKTMFKLAIQEEVAAGNYALGTKENPSYIDISAKWMAASVQTRMGEPVTKNMMDAFNSVDPRIQLRITNSVAGSDSDAMYDALNYGQFDLGMGAITGMQAWPLDFFQVLCSDNRSGFCLNWGVDTSVDDGDIVYDGKTWSFDALWEAGTSGTCAVEGESFTPLTVKGLKDSKSTLDADAKTATFDLFWTAIAAEGVTATLKSISLEDYATNSGAGTGAISKDVLASSTIKTDAVASDGTICTSAHFVCPTEFDTPVIPASYAKYYYMVDVYLTYDIKTSSGLEFEMTYYTFVLTSYAGGGLISII